MLPRVKTVFGFAALALVLIGGVGLYLGLSEGGALRERLPTGDARNGVGTKFEEARKELEGQLRWPWADAQGICIELGELYQANGYNGEAVRCYELAEEFGEDVEPRVRYLWANALGQLSRIDEMVEGLEAVLKSEPDYLPARLRLAEVLLKSGRGREALEHYGDVLKRDSDNPWAHLAVAREELRKRAFGEAIERLKRLMLSHPDSAEGAALLSQALEQDGQSDLARAVRNNAPKQKAAPMEDPWLEGLRERCVDMQLLSFAFEDYLKAGAFEKAFEYLDRMQAVDPEDPRSYQQRGYAYYQMKRYAEAIPHFREALARGADGGTVYYYLVECERESGRKVEALVTGEEAIGLGFASADLYVTVATLLEERGKRGEAVRNLELALERDGTHAAANQKLAKLYWELGKRERSIELLEVVRRIQPQDVVSRVMIGRFSLEMGEGVRAVAVLEEAMAIDAENQDVRALLALAQLRVGNEAARTGDFDGALRYYDAAIDVAADSEEAYLNKVKLCLRLERFDEAEATVERLIARKPDEAVLYVSLGDVRQAAGDGQGARKSWEEALERAGGNAQLRAAVESRLGGDVK